MGLGASNGQKTFNFGQQPFLYRPAGLGDDTALQTQNMPTPAILDGRDHFQAITGPGEGGFLMYAEGTRADASTGKTTEALDFSDESTFTPTTANFARSSYVLDAFEETTSITFINDPAWAASGPWQILTSVDGAAFTLQNHLIVADRVSNLQFNIRSKILRFSRPGATPSFGNFYFYEPTHS